MELIFLEEKTTGYKVRTIKNASADATIAMAVDFNSAGEKLTKKSVLFQNKKYIPISLVSLIISDELVNSVIQQLNSVKAKSLNIAGNGIYTFKGSYTQDQIDNYVYELLFKVLTSDKLINKIEIIRTGGQCLLGDTKISLLDGTEVEIQDLIKGQKYWIYGCNTNGKVIPVECIAQGITRTEYEYCEIILDNNEVIRCTLDHKFMLRNGTYLQAKDLQINQSLMPLYRKISNSKDKIKGYEMYLDNSNNDWYFTHRLVANETKLEDKQNKKIALLDSNIEKRLVVHHIDFNKRNNVPSNLEWMGLNEHWRYHASLGEDNIKEFNDKAWNSENPNYNDWENYRKENRIQLAEARANISPEVKMKTGKESHQKYLLPYAKSDVGRKKSSEIGKINGKINLAIYNRSDKHKQDVIKQNLERNSAKIMNINKLVNYAVKLIELGIKLNQENWDKNKPNGFPKFNNIVWIDKFGSYDEFIKIVENKIKNNGLINHKVKSVKIVKSKNLTNFYDITVPETNNFALTAGVFVHNSGVDEAGAKAGIKLNIPTIILAPKGWKFRDVNGKDISNEKLFKQRFL